MPRRNYLLGLLLVVLSAGGSAAVASNPRPFFGQVSATWTNFLAGFTPAGTSFTGGGPVTYMGNTTQAGTLFLESTPVSPGIYPGYGSVVITAEKNRGTVTFEYWGLLDEATGVGIAFFTFTGGTGKFADVSGGGVLYALIDLSELPNPSMSVILDGEISY